MRTSSTFPKLLRIATLTALTLWAAVSLGRIIQQTISPAGGNETDWLITILQPAGLLYVVFVAPEREFQNYQGVFQNMISSIKLPGR